MGIRAGTELARNVVAANLTAANTTVGAGVSGAFYPSTDMRGASGGFFNALVYGTFVGTIVLERTFDDGTTWVTVYDEAGAAISLTAPGARRLREPEKGVKYRWHCTAYTSGTANVRISQ